MFSHLEKIIILLDDILLPTWKLSNKWSENMYRTHFLSLVVNHITENGLQENVKPV